MVRRFEFAFDPRFSLPLAAIGIRPTNSELVLTDRHLDVRFGPWRLQTRRENLRGACAAGPFTWFKVLGPHGSMSDGGVTFGTNAERGVCVTFHEPVGALFGRKLLRHPGMTVTVAETDALLDELGLDPC